MALVPCVAKIAESVLAVPVLKALSGDSNQTAYKPGRGCEDALAKVTHRIDKAVTGGKRMLMVMVDLKSAFDRVGRSYVQHLLAERAK